MGDKRKTNLKYPLLGDKHWLEEQYTKRRYSTSEIAKIVGCTKDGVRVALIRHGIELRSAGETLLAISERKGFKSKYVELNDKDWLYNKYVVERLSLEEISSIVGAKNHNSVRQALSAYGIKIRNISEGLTERREDDGFRINDSVINGCLLGDAGLQCYNKHSDVSLPYFYKRNIFYDHVLYVANILFEKNAESRIKYNERQLNGKPFHAFYLSSLTHKGLSDYWKKWYPKNNNYVKLVPRDINMDKDLLLHWFLDDGTTSWRNRNYKNRWKQRKKQVRLTFCTECFSYDDQNFLCDLINDQFNLKAKTSPVCGSYRIKIPQSKVPDFFDIIGPCPEEVPSMAYKWKLPYN